MSKMYLNVFVLYNNCLQAQSKKYTERLHAHYRARLVKKLRGCFDCFDCSLVAKTWNLSSRGSDVPMDQRQYIDPGNYLDIKELLSTFTSEIERSKTKLDGLIGQGNYMFS